MDVLEQSTDVLRLAMRQFTGIHNGIPQNLSDLCKLLVTCTILKHLLFSRCEEIGFKTDYQVQKICNSLLLVPHYEVWSEIGEKERRPYRSLS